MSLSSEQLLERLVADKILEDKAAKDVLKEAKRYKKDAEDVIFSKNLAKPEDVLKSKSKLLKIPYKVIDIENIDRDLVNKVSADTIMTYKVFPIKWQGDTLIFGVVDPTDLRAKE